ncbi:MAG: glycosyltransferase family 9 protein [Saprospiraceae bacterium]
MKFLIIQTAFIGDVVLATAIVEKLHNHYPSSSIDFLLRKGNETLLYDHPYVEKVLIFDKKNHKYRNLRFMIRFIREQKYDYVINVQRFFTTGLITALSGAKHTIGFDKNPLSYLFSQRVKHEISAHGDGTHEVARNLKLIEKLTDTTFFKPKLYPTLEDFKKVSGTKDYVCIAPASVWFTKQLPAHKWIELINGLPEDLTIILLGAKGDFDLCEDIKSSIVNRQSSIQNLAGKLTFLQSAALMKNAKMNYVNDSAPLHFASAMNAPVTAFFCSTIPAFGFGPLSDDSQIAEIDYKLYCRPCGLHGYDKCPEGHFKCSEIEIKSPLVAEV